MVRASSAEAYQEIVKILPNTTRPVYEAIYFHPGICIGEIGKLLSTPQSTFQNSTVSARVNNLLKCGLVHYLENEGWTDEKNRYKKKPSSVSKMTVMMLMPNDVFTVDPSQIKLKSREKIIDVSFGADKFQVQTNLL